jgi:hypothetical protein
MKYQVSEKLNFGPEIAVWDTTARPRERKPARQGASGAARTLIFFIIIELRQALGLALALALASIV